MRNNNSKSTGLILVLFSLLLFACSCTEKTVWFHENCTDPKAITLNDGSVLILSTNHSYITVTKYSINWDLIYKDARKDSISYDGNAQLLQTSELPSRPSQLYLGLHLRGVSTSEYLLFFKDKFEDYSTVLLSDNIYSRKNYVALQNGYILLGSMRKNSTSSKYIGSVSSYPDGLFATNKEFVSDSDQLSCFETQKNDFYCVYISEDTPYITKIALKEWKLQCTKYEPKIENTETDASEERTEDSEEKIELETTPGGKIPFDVLYLIDATDSMYFALLDVQTYCQEIANKLKAEFTSYDMKFGAVFFRDLVENVTETSRILDFTSNMDEFQSFVDSEYTEGGGDANEDWVEAYSAALDRMSWRNGLKTIIHISDYGAHGQYYSTFESDKIYYKDEGEKLDNLARRLCDTKYLTIQGFKIFKEAGYSFDRMNQVCKEHRKSTIKDFDEKVYEINGLVRQAYYDDMISDSEYFKTLIVTEVISGAQVCKLYESNEQIIKIGHRTYSYLQASAIDDSTMGMILLSPKKTCSCASETTTTTQEYDLFFIKNDIHDVDNIESFRYEFLYDKCLYEKDSTLFDPKFIAMSEKRILVVCVAKKKVLHVMAVTDGVKEIKHFSISATNYKDYLSPSFVRFGQPIGLVFLGNYLACSRNYTNIQVISYPSCNQLNKVIVPIHLTANITFTHEILNDYLGTITSHFIYVYYKYYYLNVRSVKTGKLLREGKMADDDRSYIIYPNKDNGSYFINYTAVAQDSVDGLIQGKTGYAKVITPSCWEGCYSCWEDSTEETNNCLIKCNAGYYMGQFALLHSTYLTPFIYGPLFNCYKCDYRCSECEAGPITANGTSAGMEFNYSNCLPEKCADGYYYVEDDITTCLSSGEDNYRYSTYRKIELYLDVNVWRIKICHPNCQNCSRPGTDEINHCTICIPNYHFIFGEEVPEPGNCFTGLEVKGYYVNVTDDRWHLCNEFMDGCDLCENGDVCKKCKDGYGLLAKNYHCQALPIPGSFVENETYHLCEYHHKGCAECPDRYQCTKCQYPFALNRTSHQCVYAPDVVPSDIIYCDDETQICKFCYELIPECYRCGKDSELICKQCMSDFTMYNSNNKECVDITPYKCVDDFYTLDDGINYYPCEEGSELCKAKYCKKYGVKLTGDFNIYKDYQEKIEDSKDETTRIAVSGGAGTIKIKKGIRYIVINSDVDQIHLTGGYFYIEVNNKVKNITLEKAYCNLYINGEVNELNLKNEGYGNVMIYGTVNKIYINDFYPDIYAHYLYTKVDEITFDWAIVNLYLNHVTSQTKLNELTALVGKYYLECGNVIDTCINKNTLPDYKSCDKCGKTFVIYDDITETHCDHVFHKDCFEKSSDSDSPYDTSSEATYETSLTCPKCNEELKY